jgi:hypothetical protein
MRHYMKEKRDFVRFQIHQMIRLSYGKEEYLQGEGLNLSEGGLLCRTEHPVEPYSKVFLMMALPETGGTKQINCEGIVVRSEKGASGYENGIAFSELKSEDRRALERYLDQELETK